MYSVVTEALTKGQEADLEVYEYMRGRAQDEQVGDSVISKVSSAVRLFQ